MVPLIVVTLFVAACVFIGLRWHNRPRIGVVDARAVAMWKALGQKGECPRVVWVDAEPESPFPYSVRYAGQWVAGYTKRMDTIHVVRGIDESERAAIAHELAHCTGLLDHDAVFYARVNVALKGLTS